MKPEPISRTALNRALLARQMLLARSEVGVAAATAQLVGLQAQQPEPPHVGLWTRLNGFTRDALLEPIQGRQIVRATTMRGTLHLMTADDYLEFRSPLQPGLSAGMNAVLRGRAEGLDLPTLVASARGLFRDRPRTFADLRTALIESAPEADERALGYAVRTHLPLVVVPDDSTWGYRPDPEFADAEDWIGRAPAVDPSPERLVLRYLAAFGPASATDAQTWSGLAGLRSVFEGLKPKLRVFRDGRRDLYDLPDAPRPPEETPAPVRFLPGFDNVILGHADRSRIIADEHRPRVVTRNLLVLPTFLVDGFVAGTWTSTRAKREANLTLTPFVPLGEGTKAELVGEGESLLRFLAPETPRLSVRFEEA